MVAPRLDAVDWPRLAAASREGRLRLHPRPQRHHRHVSERFVVHEVAASFRVHPGNEGSKYVSSVTFAII